MAGERYYANCANNTSDVIVIRNAVV